MLLVDVDSDEVAMSGCVTSGGFPNLDGVIFCFNLLNFTVSEFTDILSDMPKWKILVGIWIAKWAGFVYIYLKYF